MIQRMRSIQSATQFFLGNLNVIQLIVQFIFCQHLPLKSQKYYDSSAFWKMQEHEMESHNSCPSFPYEYFIGQFQDFLLYKNRSTPLSGYLRKSATESNENF